MNGLRTRPSPCSPDSAPPILEHEVGHLAGDRLERADAVLGLQVDDRPDVQAADRGVRVDAGRRPWRSRTREETVDVVAQPLRRDGRVFDERQRLARRPSSPSTGRARPRAGSRPAPGAAGSVSARGSGSRDRWPQGRVRARPGAAAAPRRGRRRTRRTAARRVALDEGLAQRVRGRRSVARVIEDEAVHHLDGRRPWPRMSGVARQRRRAGRRTGSTSTRLGASAAAPD